MGKKIVCFGEVLWDVFPTHKKIGGAPLNVALRLQSFGNDVFMISQVGNDKIGEDLVNYVNDNGVVTEFIAKDNNFETGKVNVSLDKNGSASYEIKYPSAWDKIRITESMKNTVKSSDAFIFGSLVARDEVSKSTLMQLLEVATYKIFDLNLRPPHYKKDLLIELMDKADFIKFNDEELFIVSDFLNSPFHGLEQNIRYIAEKTKTKSICVTKGKFGAVLLYNNAFYYNSGYQITVKDTVGAGDSFLASLTDQLLCNVEPQNAINFACAVGALVAQSEGANPKISAEAIEQFMNPA
jgi:fructokinase